MNKVLMLNLEFEYGGETKTLHPVVLIGGGDVVLVDCGYAGFLPLIEAQLLLNNIEPSSLTKIFITHHDDDHMGALYEIKQKYPHIKVIAHAPEVDYISGIKKSLRLQQAEKLLETMPEDQKAFGEGFCEQLRRLKPVAVDGIVYDGEILNWAGGCEVIATPGHMPGHASLYLNHFKAVITGDAAVVDQGHLIIANPHYTLDIEMAKASLEKLKSLNAVVYYAFHGGELTII